MFFLDGVFMFRWHCTTSPPALVPTAAAAAQYTHFISVPLAHDDKFRQLVDQFREADTNPSP